MDSPAPSPPDPPSDAAPAPGAAQTAAARPGAALRPGDLLLLAAATGLSIGFLEWGARQTLRLFGLYWGVRTEEHSLWMLPAADLVGSVAVAGALIAAARVLPRAFPARVQLFSLLLIAFASVFFVYEDTVLRKATGLLAAGLAFQFSRAAAARTEKLLWFARRAVPALALVAVVAAAGVHGKRAIEERDAFAAMPPARPGSPNVLLVVLDTVRAQSLGLHGHARDTSPRLTEFAKTGVTFDRAVAPAPWTLPTHGSLFTGRPVHDLDVRWAKPMDGRHPTLAEVLSAQGYATAGFAANPDYCPRGSGIERGFAHYDDFEVAWDQFVGNPSAFGFVRRKFRALTGGDAIYVRRPPARTVSAAALRWIDEHPGRPFFAFVNYIDAHEPYCPAPPFLGRFTDPTERLPDIDARKPGPYPQDSVDLYRGRYEEAIAGLDHDLGELFDALQERGLLDTTLVVVTSDHGEEFAEHGLLSHDRSLYMTETHVPLVFAWPGRIPAGVRVTGPAAVVDVAATILDLAGVPAEARKLPGTTLAARWGAPNPPPSQPILSEVEVAPTVGRPDWWPAGSASLRAVVLDGHHYIRSDGRRPEELYDWIADPWEQRDLSKSPEHQEILARCREALNRLVPR